MASPLEMIRNGAKHRSTRKASQMRNIRRQRTLQLENLENRSMMAVLDQIGPTIDPMPISLTTVETTPIASSISSDALDTLITSTAIHTHETLPDPNVIVEPDTFPSSALVAPTPVPPPATGLVITPTFAANITSDVNSAVIQATINQAIANYAARFTTPVTVNITFQEMTSGLGMSNTFYGSTTYTSFRAALVSHATTMDDATALAHLPAVANEPVLGGTTVIAPLPALRALGFSASNSIDGTISLNTAICNLTRTSINPTKYDLLAVVEHEIDEVLGTGSSVGGTGFFASPTFADMYRYSSTAGSRSYTTTSTAQAYFSIDGTNKLVRYNQDGAGDFGDWYSSGTPSRIQNAYASPGATPDLAEEIRLLDVVGYSTTAGTWTKVTATNPAGGSGTMLLLSDGSVMVQGPGVSKRWDRLVPDANGNYIGGSWTTMGSMALERLYTGSNVLPSGKVFNLGGEYSGPSGTANWVNSGELYDPVTNTWSSIASFPQSQFGDDPTIVLSNGKILAGYLSGPQTYLYDPVANTWAGTGTKLRSDASDEETWVMLPDGSVLSYDIFSSISTGVGHAQRYIPSTGTWVDAGTVPVALSSAALGYELGPATLLPDGRVLQIGANNNSAIYTPSTNTWVAGPSIPAGLGADDAPGAMMPNGHFIFAVDTPKFNAPTKLFDYDPVANTMTDITPTGALGTELASSPAYINRLLVLPNGHILMNTSRNTLWDYEPVGSPAISWAPTISSVVKTDATTYTLTGTQLTGISEGASYGDDAEMSSNYPIVRLTNSSGVVKYARSFNWTPGVATGSTPTTVQFTMPAGFGPGTYQLSVIANGIASTAVTLVDAAVPSISVSVSPSSVLEDGAANLIYTYALSSAAATPLTVNFALSGTAGTSGDYTVVGATSYNTSTGVGTLTIPAGATSATVTVDPTIDTTVEADESVINTLAAGTGYTLGGTTIATGTITNDDVVIPAISLSVSPSNVLEDGAANLIYTYSLSAATTVPVTVNFTLSGTAGTSGDYTVVGATSYNTSTGVGTLTIPAGSTSASVTVDPTADTTFEADETVINTLTAGSGYTVGGVTTVTGTITNDDVLIPAISLSVSPSSVLEDGAANLIYTYSLSAATTVPVTVNFALSGTAGTSGDYTVIGATSYDTSTGVGTLTIPAGSTSATVTVDPTADTTFEADETVINTLSSGSGYTLGGVTTVTGTIANDDTFVVVNRQFDFGTAASPVEPTYTQVTNTSTYSAATGFGWQSGTISSRDRGTGTNINRDFNFTPNGVFAVDVPNGTYNVTITMADTVSLHDQMKVSLEGTQVDNVTINAGVVYTHTYQVTVSDSQMTLLLADGGGTDTNVIINGLVIQSVVTTVPSLSLSVSPSSVLEDGAANLIYTYALSAASATPLTVNFILSGTAGTSGDYTVIGATSYNTSTGVGTLTIPAGATSATVTVDPSADTTIEADETVINTLGSGSGYTLGGVTTVTGTITNDDVAALPVVSISVAPSSVLEDGAANLVYTYALSAASATPVTVNFTLSGTAGTNGDYTVIGATSYNTSTGVGTLTIPAGSTSVTVTVDPTADTTVEADETVINTLAAGSGYTLGGVTTVTGTITNDDTIVVTTRQFDFGTAASPVEPGYTQVTNTSTYSAATGFGWQSGTISSRDRGTGTNINRDFNFTPNGVFAVDVANGTYNVTITMADTVSLHDQMKVSLEGTQVDNVTINAGVVYTHTYQVTVSDSQMTLLLADGGGTDANAIINGLVIQPVVTSVPSLSISVSPSSVLEDGAANLIYTYALSSASATPVTVNFTLSGTAGTSGDYTVLGATSYNTSSGVGTLTIPAGSTSATVTVDPSADTTIEADETVINTLAAGSGYTLGGVTTVTGTITNDDVAALPAVSLSVSPSSVLEDGVANLVYTYALSTASATPVTVNFSLSGTAGTSGDYTVLGATSYNTSTGVGTLTIPAGSTSATVTVDPSADTTVEADETVINTLTSGSGYTLGGVTTVTGTITNDDTIVVTTRQFDFGTAASPVEPGYTQVTNTSTYSAATGFGWQSGTISSRDRGSGTNINRDFNFTPNGVFAVDVANGTYNVTITMADSVSLHDQMKVSLEGTQVDNVTINAGVVYTHTYQVTVSDSQMTLLLADGGGTDTNVIINGLVIQSVGPSARVGNVAAVISPSVKTEQVASANAGNSNASLVIGNQAVQSFAKLNDELVDEDALALLESTSSEETSSTDRFFDLLGSHDSWLSE